MPNTFSFAQMWARKMQDKLEKVNVAKEIANVELRAQLTYGQIINKQYRSAIKAQTYTRETDVTIQTFTDTNETLTVNTLSVAPFKVDDFDALQSTYSTQKLYAEDSVIQVANLIDGDVLTEATSAVAANIIDDSIINPTTGTAGNGFTLDTSNVLTMFTTAAKLLQKQNVDFSAGIAAVISPSVEQILLQYLAGKNTSLGDTTNLNGHLGKFYGMDLYRSNNLTAVATWLPTATPANNDTVSIAGNSTGTITFTFVTTIGTTAGNVLINALNGSVTNLVGLINAPGTTNANQVAFTGNSLYDLQTKFSAVDNTGSMVVTGKGQSILTLGSSGANAASTWTAAKQIQHVLICKKGCIDLIVQQQPKVEVKPIPAQFGVNVLVGALWGKKTFNQGTKEMVDVKVRYDATGF